MGMRFFPRYYFVLLPVVALMAARGFTLLGRKRLVVAVALLLLIPLARFGPTYVAAVHAARLARYGHGSRQPRRRGAGPRLRSPRDTLFVWGYRPEFYVYTGRAGSHPAISIRSRSRVCPPTAISRNPRRSRSLCRASAAKSWQAAGRLSLSMGWGRITRNWPSRASPAFDPGWPAIARWGAPREA